MAALIIRPCRERCRRFLGACTVVSNFHDRAPSSGRLSQCDGQHRRRESALRCFAIMQSGQCPAWSRCHGCVSGHRLVDRERWPRRCNGIREWSHEGGSRCIHSSAARSAVFDVADLDAMRRVWPSANRVAAHNVSYSASKAVVVGTLDGNVAFITGVARVRAAPRSEAGARESRISHQSAPTSSRSVPLSMRVWPSSASGHRLANAERSTG